MIRIPKSVPVVMREIVVLAIRRKLFKATSISIGTEARRKKLIFGKLFFFNAPETGIISNPMRDPK